MSRFIEENKNYSPVLTLSTRTDPEGGDVANPCVFSWSNKHAIPQPEVLVLVHGFGNHLREAQDRYLAFRSGQETGLQKGDADRLESMLGDTFWPGDADWMGLLDKLDFLVYPAAIGNAVQSAQALGDYLLSRSDVQSLNFIGHSMGCRVILETIRYMQGKVGVKVVDKVFLMAAAVPVTMIFPPDGRLYDAIQIHYCPVKRGASHPRTSIGAGQRPILLGADLNSDDREMRGFPGLTPPRSTHEHRQDPVRPDHGVRPLDPTSKPPCTHVYRFYWCRYSREPSSHAPSSPTSTQPISSTPPTN